MASSHDSGIIDTKLRAPQLPAGALARPRLVERLNASRQRAVLVSGPAGFGKSVLATQWLRLTAVPHAWLQLDALDNDPKRLLSHVGAALGTLGTEAALQAAAVLRGAGAGADVAHNRELLAALGGLEPATVLVLDDVHVLEAGPSMELVRALLELRVTAPRLVLLTRVDPPLPLARLRVAGELLEVREQDLRFTRGEAADLFARLLPGGLDAELVTRLERRTEGWAAGLRMAALALEHAPDRRAVVDAFTGSHRFIADYLLEEAVSRQPPAVQRFLMDTSLLPRFTAEMCAAVMQDPAARNLLHDIEAANLFLVPLGPDRQWYRYHHLFAELLQYRLRRLDPGRVDGLHERASMWFEEQGDVAEAIEHAAQLPTPARLTSLLDRHAMTILARSEVGNMKRWLRHVPDPLAQPYPTFLLSLGWLRLITERAPDLEPLFAAADTVLSSGPAGYDDDACQTLRFEFDILRAFAARYGGRLEDALRTGARVLDELPVDSAALRGRILFNQGRVYMMLGEMARARHLLERSIEENLRADTAYLVLTGLGQAAAVLLETDGAPRAQAKLESAIRLAEERGLSRLPAFATVLYHLGHVHTIADELDAAESYLDRAMTMGALSGMPEGRANGLVGMARVRAAQGRFDEADALLLEAEALAHAENLVLIDHDISVPRTRHALYLAAAGRTAPLPAELQIGPPGAGGRWTALEETRCLHCLIGALRSPLPGARELAASAAARIRANSEPLGRHIAPCVARVAEALLSDSADRWALLDRTLRHAAARRYVLPLLEIGPPLRPLLQAALGQSLSRAARAHAKLLLERLDVMYPPDTAADAALTAMPATTGGSGLPDARLPAVSALTEREREVLAHLCHGLSNKAIARSMYVSPETVKTHLKHIYDKLEVARRRDAVERARALGLQ
jgi:LuxR family transcriptional regulator, maltose regulon positive regulatory protein